jgi:predicted membrane-bound mannosyltransferase
MPTLQRALVSALATVFAVSAAYAEKPSPKPQEVFASYWTSEPGWDTELQLKNNLAS